MAFAVSVMMIMPIFKRALVKDHSASELVTTAAAAAAARY